MDLEITPELKLAVPNNDSTGFFFSEPLSETAVALYYRLIAKTYAMITEDRLPIQTCVAMARFYLKDAATELKKEKDSKAFLTEIMRMTDYVSIEEKGTKRRSVVNAIKQQIITKEEWEAVEGAFIFFMLTSAALKARFMKMQDIAGTALSVGGQAILATYTEYADSMRKLQQEENLEEMEVL